MRFRLNQTNRRYIKSCLTIILISNLIYVVIAPVLDTAFGVNDLPMMYMIGLTCTTVISCLVALSATRSSIAMELANERLAHQSVALRAARDRADQAAQAKSDFLAMISHEVRTPLNGVLGLAQVLKNRPLSETDAELADKLHLSGEALLEILNDILDLSKIEAGEMRISLTPADLRSEVNRVRELFAALATDKGLTFIVNFDDDVPGFLEMDPNRVRQCLSNLVSNALKFTPHGGVTVDVSVDSPGAPDQTIRMRVSDTGIGIDTTAQARIFEPFSQADGSTSRTFGGTGLGLAITRRLAQRMGGGLDLVSSTPGAGSVFQVSFKAASTLKSANTENNVIPVPQSMLSMPPLGLREFEGASFLIVDDTETNRMVLRLMLKDTGAQIAEAADGIEALEKMAQHSFDLVFLDVHMPKMTGPEVLEEMRASARLRDTPVIVTTADAMIGDKERFLEMGMDGYVSKPVDARLLIAETRNVLDTFGAKQSARDGSFSPPQKLIKPA